VGGQGAVLCEPMWTTVERRGGGGGVGYKQDVHALLNYIGLKKLQNSFDYQGENAKHPKSGIFDS